MLVVDLREDGGDKTEYSQSSEITDFLVNRVFNDTATAHAPPRGFFYGYRG